MIKINVCTHNDGNIYQYEPFPCHCLQPDSVPGRFCSVLFRQTYVG